MDESLKPIVRNWRSINLCMERILMHVNPAYEHTNSTLAPVPLRLDPSREILCPESIECGRLRKSKWNQ